MTSVAGLADPALVGIARAVERIGVLRAFDVVDIGEGVVDPSRQRH